MPITNSNPFSFGSTAWFYDWIATLAYGGAIQRSQKAVLPFITSQESVLIVGGGTGWILQDLARLNVPLKITYLEISSRMLALAQYKLSRLPTHKLMVNFRLGTEADLKSGEIFEVIFTPFVLDLYPEVKLPTMLKKLLDHLSPNGLWLLADFFISTKHTGWQKHWRYVLTKIMYCFFSWLTGLPTKSLPNLELLFKQLPLTRIKSYAFFKGFIQAHVFQRNLVKESK